MARVPNAIHESQRRVGENSIRAMVLDDNGGTGDPAGFAQQLLSVVRMVQDVDEKYHVERTVLERKVHPVELLHRNRGAASRRHLEPQNRDIGASANERLREQAIPTTHIEDAGSVGND